MNNLMVKVYGFLRPCNESCLASLGSALCLLGDAAEDVLSLQGDLLNISFEGTFFPIDDFLEALAPCLNSASEGKVDYIDMEAWVLHRHRFEAGKIISSKGDLNNILAYSGH